MSLYFQKMLLHSFHCIWQYIFPNHAVFRNMDNNGFRYSYVSISVYTFSMKNSWNELITFLTTLAFRSTDDLVQFAISTKAQWSVSVGRWWQNCSDRFTYTDDSLMAQYFCKRFWSRFRFKNLNLNRDHFWLDDPVKDLCFSGSLQTAYYRVWGFVIEFW